MLKTFLVHGSNLALVAGLVGLVAVWFLHLAPMFPAGFLLGAVLFMVSEYGLHRFAFHAAPSRFKFILKLQHRLHYDHHVTPQRLDLLFLPLWFLLPNLAITWGMTALLFGSAAIGLSILFGAMLAVLYYEWVHYIAHIPYRPRSRFGAWMKKYHLWHHFKNEQMWFGVTNPLGDMVAGTKADPNAVEKSGSTKYLHGGDSDPSP